MSDYEKYLFRGKRKDNGEWIYGYYCVFNGMIHCIYTGYAETDCGDIYPDYYEVDPDTVGQFTGYCDESQHNAFEGDILSYCSGLNYGVIKYGRYSSPFSIGQDIGFYVEWVSDRDRNIHRKDLGYWLSAGTAEIVGNIYDNPELLGGENNGNN